MSPRHTDRSHPSHDLVTGSLTDGRRPALRSGNGLSPSFLPTAGDRRDQPPSGERRAVVGAIWQVSGRKGATYQGLKIVARLFTVLAAGPAELLRVLVPRGR